MGDGTNAEWLARSLRAVWHPCTQMKQHETLPLVPVARGAGAWLYDFDGNRYLDAVSSWWVNLFGHAHPRINAALRAQLGELDHVLLAGFTHQPVVELSERLAALAPPGLGHAFYGSDGASATEIALKMSYHFWRNRGYPDKRGYVSLAGGYHGETLGALAVTDVALFRDTYAPLLNANAVVPCPDPRKGVDVESRGRRARRAPRAASRDHRGDDRRAAGAGRHRDGDVRRRVPRACARDHGAPRRAPDRRRDHDRVRPDGDDVRVGAGRRHPRRTSCACPRGSPAATCRCRAC